MAEQCSGLNEGQESAEDMEEVRMLSTVGREEANLILGSMEQVAGATTPALTVMCVNLYKHRRTKTACKKLKMSNTQNMGKYNMTVKTKS